MGSTSECLPRRRRTPEAFPPRPAAWLAAAFVSLTLPGTAPVTVRAEPGTPAAEAAVGRREAEDGGAAPRVASRSKPADPKPAPAPVADDPIARAKQAIADCRAKYAGVRDYTCTFVKRERLDGRLLPAHVMDMKARATPPSIYFKFRTPNKGREAIYVAGRNGGRVVAHDVGIGKFLAGTMNLDPRGAMAMEDCRHPITEAGIGALIATVADRWDAELTPEESLVALNPGLRIGKHGCTMIEVVHPSRHPQFLFHKVRLYIAHEHGLPIRYEAFDWPSRPGVAPELVEEYSYLDLKLNVGLGDRDFDPDNRAYSFGRF